MKESKGIILTKNIALGKLTLEATLNGAEGAFVRI